MPIQTLNCKLNTETIDNSNQYKYIYIHIRSDPKAKHWI